MTIDQAARDRITTALDATLFVEAGAGSGKTTALVDRVVALVRCGEQLDSIAAITFTDKAGAELRDRLRSKLTEIADTGADGAELCRAALDQLDGAAIGTLHSFAQRVLSEHPLAAGLPPRIEVLDEVASGVAFQRRWAQFRDQLLEEPAMERPLLLLLAGGMRAEALAVLASAFDDNWDLVAEKVPAHPGPIPDLGALLGPALAEIDAAVALQRHCREPKTDPLWRKVQAVADFAAAIRGLTDEGEQIERIGEAEGLRKLGAGAQTRWECDIAAVKEAATRGLDAVVAARKQVLDACAHHVGSAIRTFTLAAADQRRAAGELEFHDLLVMARGLVRSDADARRVLHARYQRLLLDEFQDTDPIQLELAVRIAAADPGSPEAGTAPWHDVPLRPGHLFFVGDPKQSIYRFRRADIGLFILTRDHIGRDGGVVELTSNFRSSRPIIEWINGVFGALIHRDDNGGVPSQPGYLPLDAERDGPSGGPPVAVVGTQPHPGLRADALRQVEARSVAAAITRIMAEGWRVAGDDAGDRLFDAGRPARLGDITILVPARTSLPFLEDALEAAGIPFRAEASSLVYATRAVRDLFAVLRAVDDPTDHLAVVTALRTPLLGCGDDDLVRYKVGARGGWNYLAPFPRELLEDDPVRLGLDYLRARHEERQWLAPSELLSRIATDRRAFELGVAEGRPRDLWRRLRFVIDQARAWSDATRGGLREYLRWVAQQTAEGARVAEAVLPETDDDAVRVMTIHAAKGLEFPITILSGMTTEPRRQMAAAEVSFPPNGPVGYRFWGRISTETYDGFQPIDEQMGDNERLRLLYVACTRARDHLVVSVHRKGDASRTNAAVIAAAMPSPCPDIGGGEIDAPNAPPPAPPPPILPFAEWEAEWSAARARAHRRTTVAATALTVDGDPDPGLEKRPRDLDLPPWLKGRYGSAVGRAVHGVLQTIDLATGDRLEALVAAQCQAEAIPHQAGDVAALVRRALGSDVLRAAAGAPHWREVYACTPIAGRMLEGYVDLLYRSAAGLVVVDYKTASTADPAVLDSRLDAYRLQGASYAQAIAATTGEEVVRVTFLFLTPEGAIARDLPDVAGAVAEVRSLVAAGQEILTV